MNDKISEITMKIDKSKFRSIQKSLREIKKRIRKGIVSRKLDQTPICLSLGSFKSDKKYLDLKYDIYLETREEYIWVS